MLPRKKIIVGLVVSILLLSPMRVLSHKDSSKIMHFYNKVLTVFGLKKSAEQTKQNKATSKNKKAAVSEEKKTIFARIIAYLKGLFFKDEENNGKPGYGTIEKKMEQLLKNKKISPEEMLQKLKKMKQEVSKINAKDKKILRRKIEKEISKLEETTDYSDSSDSDDSSDFKSSERSDSKSTGSRSASDENESKSGEDKGHQAVLKEEVKQEKDLKITDENTLGYDGVSESEDAEFEDNAKRESSSEIDEKAEEILKLEMVKTAELRGHLEKEKSMDLFNKCYEQHYSICDDVEEAKKSIANIGLQIEEIRKDLDNMGLSQGQRDNINKLFKKTTEAHAQFEEKLNMLADFSKKLSIEELQQLIFNEKELRALKQKELKYKQGQLNAMRDAFEEQLVLKQQAGQKKLHREISYVDKKILEADILRDLLLQDLDTTEMSAEVANRLSEIEKKDAKLTENLQQKEVLIVALTREATSTEDLQNILKKKKSILNLTEQRAALASEMEKLLPALESSSEDEAEDAAPIKMEDEKKEIYKGVDEIFGSVVKNVKQDEKIEAEQEGNADRALLQLEINGARKEKQKLFKSIEDKKGRINHLLSDNMKLLILSGRDFSGYSSFNRGKLYKKELKSTQAKIKFFEAEAKKTETIDGYQEWLKQERILTDYMKQVDHNLMVRIINLETQKEELEKWIAAKSDKKRGIVQGGNIDQEKRSRFSPEDIFSKEFLEKEDGAANTLGGLLDGKKISFGEKEDDGEVEKIEEVKVPVFEESTDAMKQKTIEEVLSSKDHISPESIKAKVTEKRKEIIHTL